MPEAAVLQGGQLEQARWRAPACTHWPANSRSRHLVALAGRLHWTGDADALLGRVGAISSLRRLRYWSTSDKAWRAMVLDASAVTAPDGSGRRGDFTAAEMSNGLPRHYWIQDNRTGAAVYRIEVLEYGRDRVAVSQDNATPIRAYGLTLFEPGALQTVVFAERLSPTEWGLYLLSRIDAEGSSFLAAGHEASSANRALALFRHLAGLAPDDGPPLLR